MDKLVTTTKTTVRWLNIDTTLFHQGWTVGWKTLLEVGTNHQDSYTEIKKKTIILDTTINLKLLIYDYNNDL